VHQETINGGRRGWGLPVLTVCLTASRHSRKKVRGGQGEERLGQNAGCNVSYYSKLGAGGNCECRGRGERIDRGGGEVYAFLPMVLSGQRKRGEGVDKLSPTSIRSIEGKKRGEASSWKNTWGQLKPYATVASERRAENRSEKGGKEGRHGKKKERSFGGRKRKMEGNRSIRALYFTGSIKEIGRKGGRGLNPY